jgi:hypothetical protein
MDRCNVTGETENLFGFYINGDFGQKAEYFVADEFEFYLCEAQYKDFMSKGRDIVVNLNRDDYTKQHDKWFTSREIYELIQTFKYVPKGYYNFSWLQHTYEEEQWMWDNKGIDIFEYVDYERILDLAFYYNFDDEKMCEIISRRFPDKHNPYKKETGEQSYIEHLQSLSKDELIHILLNNKIGFQV